MPSALQVGDVLAMRAWSVLDEQAAVNTYCYRVNAVTGGGVQDQDFCSDFDTLFMSPFYQALQPPTVEYRGTQAYLIHRLAGGLPNPVISLAGAHVGTHGTGPMPRNAAVIMKYATALRGPGGRGRLYLPFVDGDYVADNGRPTAALGVIVNSVCSTLLTPITITRTTNTATLSWVLAHRKKGTPFAANEILTAQLSDRIGTMKKRGDYGKANTSPI